MTDEPDHRIDKRSTPVMNDDNAFKLGVFGTNLRGGVTLADVEGNLRGTWGETERLARHADRLGLDAIVPIARWRGYGGRANLGDRSFETFTWAAGLLACTRRIMVFSTFHVPLGHPVFAAKISATVDHISGGRFGLNVVAGWNAAELQMFGLTQREHDERYEVADEWTRALTQLWSAAGEQDFHGRFFDIPRGFSEPKPLQDPYPVIMNAGTSPAGREFAARHSDLIFAGLTTLDTASDQVSEIKRLARERYGREIRVFGRAHIVCRDTEQRARADWDLIHRQRADREAAIETTDMNRANSQSTPYDELKRERMLEGMIAGFFSLPVLGTPDQVAERLLELHRLGLDGVALSWPDYDEGLAQLEAELLPRLVQAGVRRAPAAAPVDGPVEGRELASTPGTAGS
jgi:alkanesulfonate monooxygenase SsuD/methylene tetrahydromethanopterin reductase-like flavin-dependent oxidoreductase (luciferase family)